jgi:SAM-dependent methyltransferase
MTASVTVVLLVKGEKNDVTFCAAMTATNTKYPPPGGTTLRPRDDGPADPARFVERSAHPDYPRTSAYDPEWVFLNHMGPNVLWLTEWLTHVLDLQPGMRVLDLGCGTAISSIFLAREFAVQVWAADLWISPDENSKRITEADVAERVFPISVEAHALPFAAGFFDAIVSVDAYHYFGTDVRYLAYLTRYARADARIGIAVPSNSADPDEMPDDITPFKGVAGGDFFTFRSADWWRRHWEMSGVVDVEHADPLPNGWDDWYRWSEVGAAWSGGEAAESGDAPLILTESGRTLGFARVVGRVR